MKYCRRCYGVLPEGELGACSKCNHAFDTNVARTYLRRPFPRWYEVAIHLFFTTVVAIAVAFVVSFHQAASTSNH